MPPPRTPLLRHLCTWPSSPALPRDWGTSSCPPPRSYPPFAALRTKVSHSQVYPYPFWCQGTLEFREDTGVCSLIHCQIENVLSLIAGVALVCMFWGNICEYHECRLKVDRLIIGNVFAMKITGVLYVQEQQTDRMSEAIKDFAAFLLRIQLVRHSIHTFLSSFINSPIRNRLN